MTCWRLVACRVPFLSAMLALLLFDVLLLSAQEVQLVRGCKKLPTSVKIRTVCKTIALSIMVVGLT